VSRLLLEWFQRRGPAVIALAKIPKRSAAAIAATRRETIALYRIEAQIARDRWPRIFTGVKNGDQLPTGEDDPMDHRAHQHDRGQFCVRCHEAKYESGQTQRGMLR
jgi:hypothetical protein